MKLIICCTLIKRFAKIRKVTTDMDLSIQRTEELRGHSEQIVADLQSKLADARAAEAKAQGNLQKAEISSKQAQAE
jgi:hypothetical protein